MRNEGLLEIVLKGKMEGKRTGGRLRMGLLDDVMARTYAKMKRRAEY